LLLFFLNFLPHAGFITEEGTVEQSKTNEYNWIIDPLDGTTNFLHGLPVYAISVGLSYKQEVILGVVHDVVHHESYHAIKDGKRLL
jgi:myo-inositol-1(or 4)-monophosphatase